MRGLVGWQQGYSPADRLDESLTESASGLTFQGAHPLVTLENVRCVMPEDYYMRYPEWSNAVEYEKGDKVRKGEDVYIATADNTASDPTTATDKWQSFSILNDFLTDLGDQCAAQVVQTFLQIKSILKESKNLLERRTFFDGAGRINASIEPKGRLVGMEITPAYAMGVTAKIGRIGLQFTGGTGTVRVYLFHSSRVEPLYTADLEYTRTNGGFQWFDLNDWYLPYIRGDKDSGGSWYLVYDEDELPVGMEAINVSKDWSREPCGTCNIGDLAGWRELTKYLNISPFRVPASDDFAEYPEMWDISENVYTNTLNYGMNVEVTVACDLTDFIISQRDIFATVLQRQMAATILRTLALNPNVRVNRNQSNASRNELLYEVDGNTDGRATGLGYELKKAYEALDIDTRGIDRICLTCRPVGVKYRTV